MPRLATDARDLAALLHVHVDSRVPPWEPDPRDGIVARERPDLDLEGLTERVLANIQERLRQETIRQYGFLGGLT